MLKIAFTAFMLPLLLLLGSQDGNSSNALNAAKTTSARQGHSGTIQKMIVEDASVTMQLDLNGLNGNSSLVARPVTLQFSVAANSFFPILVFNDLLRTVQPGSMALIPSCAGGIPALP